jgi:transposase
MKHASMKVTIGVDVAKETLETRCIDTDSGRRIHSQRYPNAKAGYRLLIQLLIQQARRFGEIHLIMEATGNYHAGLCQALTRARLPFSVVNPLQIKRFGQMKLSRCKTDKADAALIAAYGREQKPALYQEPSPVRKQLRQIVTTIEPLVKQRTALSNLMHAQQQLPECARICMQVLRTQLRAIERGIDKLSAERDRLVEQAYMPVRRLIESVKGVGPETTTTLIAYVGDLSGFLTHKQLAAYIGLNPVPKESGKINVAMHISTQGHASLRTLL